MELVDQHLSLCHKYLKIVPFFEPSFIVKLTELDTNSGPYVAIYVIKFTHYRLQYWFYRIEGRLSSALLRAKDVGSRKWVEIVIRVCLKMIAVLVICLQK